MIDGHAVEPRVQVRSVRATGQEGDGAAVRAEVLGDQVDQTLADAVDRRLVDEDVAAVGVGVERDDLDAGRPGPP